MRGHFSFPDSVWPGTALPRPFILLICATVRRQIKYYSQWETLNQMDVNGARWCVKAPEKTSKLIQYEKFKRRYVYSNLIYEERDAGL